MKLLSLSLCYVRLTLAPLQLNPRRCAEIQLIALQSRFLIWCENEPEELEDMPSEAQNEEYDAAVTAHCALMDDIVEMAQQLIIAFGSGRIRDKAILDALCNLLESGLRYVFADDADLPVGARLPFLRPMAKYLGRVKGNDAIKKKIESFLNEKEAILRATPEYADLLAYDLESIVEFRKAGGFNAFPISEQPAATTSVASEDSVSSTSLSPVLEGDEENEEESPFPHEAAAPRDDESASEESLAAAAADMDSDGEGSQSTASRKRRVSSASSSTTKRPKSDASAGMSEASKSQRTLRNTKYTPVASPLSSTPSSMATESIFDGVDGKRRRGSFGGKRKSGADEESAPFRSQKTNKFSGLSESTIQHAECDTDED